MVPGYTNVVAREWFMLPLLMWRLLISHIESFAGTVVGGGGGGGEKLRYG